MIWTEEELEWLENNRVFLEDILSKDENIIGAFNALSGVEAPIPADWVSAVPKMTTAFKILYSIVLLKFKANFMILPISIRDTQYDDYDRHIYINYEFGVDLGDGLQTILFKTGLDFTLRGPFKRSDIDQALWSNSIEYLRSLGITQELIDLTPFPSINNYG